MEESLFEIAAEAVVGGELSTLESLLHNHPDLVRQRSTRPHRATLLHYVAANGVEEERQKTPANAVDIATALLKAGAGVDALADMYGGQQTTMTMLVSSCHPAEAGVQVALVETLIRFGASVDGPPLMTALGFGYLPAAKALAKAGAPADSLPAAAGLGNLTDVARLLPEAGEEDRHKALALASQHGHTEIVKLLLEAKEDPNRFNPAGAHPHSTPLHQAALAGHLEVVRLLVDRGARLDIEDKIYHGTPLGWAIHGRRDEVAEFLRERGGER